MEMTPKIIRHPDRRPLAFSQFLEVISRVGRNGHRHPASEIIVHSEGSELSSSSVRKHFPNFHFKELNHSLYRIVAKPRSKLQSVPALSVNVKWSAVVNTT